MSKKILKKLPNTLTFCNMAIGLTIIYIMFKSPVQNTRLISCYLILCGAALDVMDGRLARRFQAVSDLGKHLDSFADLITFCIAPLFVYSSLMQIESPAGFVVFLLFPASGAYRLARYNAEDNGQYFTGLPSTAAGTILAITYLICSHLGFESQMSGYLLFFQILIILLSGLMVSRFRVKRILQKQDS